MTVIVSLKQGTEVSDIKKTLRILNAKAVLEKDVTLLFSEKEK